MNTVEPSPEMSKDPEENVSRNPLTNLRTLFGRKPRDSQDSEEGGSPRSLANGVIVFSILLNIAFLWMVISLGNTLFGMKETVAQAMLEGVTQSMVLGDNAQIQTVVNIDEQLPFAFDLALKRDTVVVLSRPTRIDNASLSIRSATLSVDAPASVTLPVGAELPITLDLTVPVDGSVPISLSVPVTISLAESDLAESLRALQSLVVPYEQLQSEIPGCWQMLLWQGDCP